MINLKNYDFKKAASSAMKETDAEIAFYRASSTIMEDKAAPLFTSDYYLGFEIVKTNDAFTKMVGIYAFRVNKHLLYAPVFYVDGKIKGTDFLYNVEEKKFVYLSPEWCNYFIGLYEEDTSGEPVDRSLSQQGKQDIEMMRIATPLYKSASIKKFASMLGIAEEKEYSSFKDAYDNMFMSFVNAKDSDNSPLHAFLKSAGIKAWNKLASALKSDEEFASNVIGLCNKEDYIPQDVLEEARKSNIKTASAKSKPRLILHKGRFNKNGVKTAVEQIEDGYSIEDNRDEKELTVIYDESPEDDYTGIVKAAPAVYNIITTDGSQVKCVAVYGNSDYGKTPALLISVDSDDKKKGIVSYFDVGSAKELYDEPNKEDKPGKHDPVVGVFRNILAKEEADEEQAKKDLDKVVKEKPEKGKIYAIWDPYYSYLSDEAFYIADVRDTGDDGSYSVKAYPAEGYETFRPWESLVEGKDITIKVNARAEEPLYDLKVFTPVVRWLELPMKKVDLAKEMKNEFGISSDYSFKKKDYRFDIIQGEFVPGSWSTLYAYNSLSTNKVASTNVKANSDGTYNVDINGHKFYNLNKMGSQIMLMANMNISEDTANYLLKTATDKGYYSQGHKCLFKKYAERIILNPDPDFFEGYDPDLGISYQIPESRVLETSEETYAPPAPRYGDMMEPSIAGIAEEVQGVSREDPDVFMETATPNMLAEFAERSGKRSVFEHGIISSLSKVSDAQMYISDFLPSLRDGMDKLARLLFLIVISPQNFIKYYGSDDIMGLENSVTSTFKSLSELTLDLIQKTSGIDINVTNKN